MSRIGKQPVTIPDGVEVSIERNTLQVKGPKGEIEQHMHPSMTLVHEDGELRVERPTDARHHRALHGLTRSLAANMVEGVTDGFRKELEIQGIGYRAQKRGTTLVLHLGFSHPVEYETPGGITVECPEPTEIVVEGVDKQLVGQVAADIRSFRPPEPYKGKGVRYKGEEIRRKAGKAAVGVGMGPGGPGA